MSLHTAHGKGQNLMGTLAGFAAWSPSADGALIMNGCVQCAPLKELEMISSSLGACSVRKSQLPVFFLHLLPTKLPPASSQRAPGTGSSKADVNSTRSQGPAWDRKVLPSTSIQRGTCHPWDILQLCFPSRSYRVHIPGLGPTTLSFVVAHPVNSHVPLPCLHQDPPPFAAKEGIAPALALHETAISCLII